jgi:hypothetical protein
MPESTNTFSYSFSSPERGDNASDLFALAPLSDFGLGDGQVLARNPRSGGEMTLPEDYFNVLNVFCGRFRTLDEHVAELMAGSDDDPARREAIREVVQAVHSGGLTLSARAICRELAPVAGATPIAERPIAAVITCDRPAALERLLDSLTGNCDLGNLAGCVVVDDSRSAESAARNRQAAGSRWLGYFGAEEAAELTAALLAELPEHERAIRFLCDRERWGDRRTHGLARNFTQLLSAGQPLVVFDDDMLCETWSPPYSASGVTFGGGQSEVEFYERHEDWRSGLQRLGHDPVAAHLRCLGLTVPEALGNLGLMRLDPEAMREATREFAQRLHRGSRVLVTECGTLGDPGTGDNRWLATLPPASLKRLLAQPKRLSRALQQRRCWLGRERPTFADSHNFSGVTGIDNRGLLPPYFPITRGEDQLFGRCVRFLYPDSVAMEYAWAMPHLPMPERAWSAKDNSFAPRSRFPGLLMFGLLDRHADCLATDPAARLAYLARVFRDLAAGTEAELFTRFVDLQHGHRAALVRRLKEQREASPAEPAEWRQYLENAIAEAQQNGPGSLRLDALQARGTTASGREALQFWREAFDGFGLGLLAWPQMREAAQRWVARKLGG